MTNKTKSVYTIVVQVGDIVDRGGRPDTIGDECSELKIMDFGSGTGWFPLAFINQFKQVYAVDVNKDLLNFLADESNGIINVILNQDLKNYQNYFDLVFSCDVFEHLSDPLKQVILINESLKCDGTCIICVPNKNSYFFTFFSILSKQVEHNK